MVDESQIVSLIIRFMIDTAILAGVPLAVATASGLLISFFQAVTQVQDQTLSQTVKIVSIAVVMLTMTSFLTGPLMSSTRNIFETFATLVR